MKMNTFIVLGIVVCFCINSIPVLSANIQQEFISEEQDATTLESTLFYQSEKLDHIPFTPQQKPDFLDMPHATTNAGPEYIILVVDIHKIRILDETLKDPEYYIDIIVDGEEPQWKNTDIMTEKEVWLQWPAIYHSVMYNENSLITIDIAMYLKNKMWFDKQVDLSRGPEKTLSLTYDPKRGDWTGGDYLGDPSGYGHASGFEDGDFNDKDFEIWFDIYQLEVADNHYLDGDTLTYWEEINVYSSNPFTDDGIQDIDEDGIPSEWEDKYGYNPFSWDDHVTLDPDQDGLQNNEEYETNEWLSHPFVQDIFIEVDFMEGKYFWSKPYTFTEESAYLLTNAFAKENIAMHVDLGIYGGGGDYAPYQERTVGMDLQSARLKYFLQGTPDHWRRGIFHWAFICSKIEYWDREVGGRMFYVDSFVLARQTIIDNSFTYIYMKFSNPTVGMASVFMHELGHTLGLFSDFGGVDNTDTTKPWKLGFWQYRIYESCMNYHYTYKLIDYSHGDDDSEFDQDDWGRLDLTRFEQEW